MHLIHGWRRVLTRAWSVRLALLAALLSGMEVALPFFEPDRGRGMFGAASGIVTILAVIARLVAQPRSLPDEKTDS